MSVTGKLYSISSIFSVTCDMAGALYSSWDLGRGWAEPTRLNPLGKGSRNTEDPAMDPADPILYYSEYTAV